MTMQMEPLSDQAVLVRFKHEQAALQFTTQLHQIAPAWMVDLVQAYFSVAVFFDLSQIQYQHVVKLIEEIDFQRSNDTSVGRRYVIPCCYERHQDLARIGKHTGLRTETVIDLHLSMEYTVYAIGFCPGFPYLGYLPVALCDVPRLETPRLQVEAGSIGLTGRQTGIYTESRPGGWNIVGQTPLELVNVQDEYFPLQTGDRLQFTRIDEAEFQRLKGERLNKEPRILQEPRTQ